MVSVDSYLPLPISFSDYLKSLQPHKEKQEQLKNAFTNLYDSLPNYGPVNRPELDTFQRLLNIIINRCLNM